MSYYEGFVQKYSNRVKINESLRKYNTFRLEGKVDVLAEPTSFEELVDMIDLCKKNLYRYSILGGGSNTLFKNDEYKGVLIVTKKLKNIEINDDVIKCSCGVTIPSLSKTALDNGLSGLERMSGIPGTIGGAILMNAGAFGTEIKDILISVTICTSLGEIKKIHPKELNLSYRHSNVKEKGYIVLECELKMKKLAIEEIKSLTEEIKNKRLSSQPYEHPSSGSVFKKEGSIAAGKLIDDCGLKGYSVGGAMISEKHANFIINKGNATFNDVRSLIEFIQNKVYEKDKIKLNTEVMFL